MWHASIGGYADAVSRRLKALAVLDRCGQAALGEWWEVSPIATHLRRRLAEHEAARVGPVVDVRQTAEGRARFEKMRPYLPPGWTEIT